ncbi:MAG: hypothetical protein IPH80_34345 [Myxococcales bacterium]|nr:hypothetical protein [Myxococcales bacterium]
MEQDQLEAAGGCWRSTAITTSAAVGCSEDTTSISGVTMNDPAGAC